MKKFVILLVIAALCLPAMADVLVASWEGTPDGAIHWGNKESVASASNMPSVYEYSTIGVTLGSQSLYWKTSGWTQGLTIAVSGGAFRGNHTLALDWSVSGVASSGYSQLYEVAVCTSTGGNGWTVLTDSAWRSENNFYWWDGCPQLRTKTATVNYSSVLNSEPFKSASTIYFVIAQNTGGDAPAGIYYDNVRLVPEPATIALLGLGLALLRKRS